jgi:hypothetical protein
MGTIFVQFDWDFYHQITGIILLKEPVSNLLRFGNKATETRW